MYFYFYHRKVEKILRGIIFSAKIMLPLGIIYIYIYMHNTKFSKMYVCVYLIALIIWQVRFAYC